MWLKVERVLNCNLILVESYDALCICIPYSECYQWLLFSEKDAHRTTQVLLWKLLFKAIQTHWEHRRKDWWLWKLSLYYGNDSRRLPSFPTPHLITGATYILPPYLWSLGKHTSLGSRPLFPGFSESWLSYYLPFDSVCESFPSSEAPPRTHQYAF